MEANTIQDQDSEAAKTFVKNNKKLLIEKFANLSSFPPDENPLTFFMAGSPGAGKTEFSKAIIKILTRPDSSMGIVRIDADEIKTVIPQYGKGKSDIVQGASAIGVEKLFDHVLKSRQNVIVDGTFANFEKSVDNVKRAVKKNRRIAIMYLYQDPLVAWQFTIKREKMEGRNIPLEAFIESFFAAKANVNKAKAMFSDKITLNLIIKDYANNFEKTHFNISNVDHFLKVRYTPRSLRSKLLNI